MVNDKTYFNYEYLDEPLHIRFDKKKKDDLLLEKYML